ncbi:MAG: hypothetical protein HC849_03765 [Oscillatoriales cyanobacterium RU_3_3]|nr:hypothetical protein [Microcoleus sp. SU_5_6]NJL69159.1 hypothetical protein [Microcoleus sp. SM1_3_4]NJM59494.1 hypothetical protein [Oscillatoriales cyanobacterium RU_3_3]NJR23155.1 hypothetical protein [Richelia sp. CSU_2_1]
MLEITFYSSENRTPYTIEVAEDFLRWLAESDFMEIGVEHLTELEIDGETAKLEVVKLGRGNNSNRKRFRDFLLEAIALESDAVLNKVADAATKDEYRAIVYKLSKLQQLRKCMENEIYQYLQRV